MGSTLERALPLQVILVWALAPKLVGSKDNRLLAPIDSIHCIRDVLFQEQLDCVRRLLY